MTFDCNRPFYKNHCAQIHRCTSGGDGNNRFYFDTIELMLHCGLQRFVRFCNEILNIRVQSKNTQNQNDMIVIYATFMKAENE